jgi:protein-disulfide isomerase
MENNKSAFMDRYLTPLAVLLAAVIIALALIYGHVVGNTGAANTGGAAAPAVAVNIKDVKTDGDPFIGNANAPTTVALFYDYQCPFCKQFEQGVTPELLKNYVDTGKTKIVFKDFQFLGNDSTTAALFARAMWEAYPDKFYPWFKAMFDAQDQEGDTGFGNLASIQKLTATIPGVDVTKVTNLMTQKKDAYQKMIDADRAEGSALGINGTPSVIVGTKLISGKSSAEFYSLTSATLDSELKK